MRKPKTKKGFTLIELVISMAIIAVLLLLATGQYRHHVEKANDIHKIADTNSLQKELKTELLHENKEFKGNPVDKNTLVGKKIYSARKIEEELPQEELYEVKNPKEYLNTVLTGKFIASANADTYYVDNGSKPNSSLFPDFGDDGKTDIIEQDTKTCSEDLYKNLKGNYRVIQHINPDKIYLQKSDGTQTEVEKKCLNTPDLTPFNIVNQNGKDGTVVLDYNTTPKYVITYYEDGDDFIDLQDHNDPEKGILLKVNKSTEIFIKNEDLSEKEVQVIYETVGEEKIAKIVNILGQGKQRDVGTS